MPINLEQLMRASKGLASLARDIAVPKNIDPPLTPGELSVLSILVGHPEPTTISELRKKTHFAQSRVSSVVQSLDQRGWVAVTTPSHDRRSTLVQAKREVIESARRVVAQAIEPQLAKALSSASEPELKAIVRGIETLNAVLERQQ